MDIFVEISLTKQTDVGKKDISIFNLALGTLTIHLYIVAFLMNLLSPNI